ncbi:polyhydroxyalkanoate synthase [Trinickia symbiotica]|uniref:Poly-beta-hydroxybutyrate polymerase n=1 Tax=Trinickia symbiotica TaxID=863227 RepID=A0A2N7X9R3_9BURK|nr:alpha/beta fold hydrolase [Trinickia symbiotica]PMS38493.1 poly-beta-hydroxybutyrate polymerase [Trinickia symbiotica]PPK46470.1 polyhydroxyalkanoate synthase [Trinickia symbiotica]
MKGIEIPSPFTLPVPMARPARTAARLGFEDGSQQASLDAAATRLDRAVYAAFARTSGGGSPTAMMLAWLEWLLHFACSPGKQYLLASDLLAYWQSLLMGVPPEHHGNGDPRVDDPGWSLWPFNLLRDAFGQFDSFWQQATTGVRGVSPRNEQIMQFAARQFTDMLSPSNCWWLNPQVLRAITETGGRNFADGACNWLEDQEDLLEGRVPGSSSRRFAPNQLGHIVAATPGKVVYRNQLIELIQYEPQTPTVWREPVLIVPSWILKYYVLDLSPHNSLVRYLVERGHTVFMVSWRNPRGEARDLGLIDYLEQGLYEALAQVRRIANGPVHAAGYCLGGTLLALAAAAHARTRRGDAPELKTITLLAAQTDFSEPGELGLFIDASRLAYLEALMWEQGYLDGEQMAAAFQMLRSHDLVWSRLVREYLLGTRTQPSDLMAWSADTTRLPYRLHLETLTHFYLHNDLAEGRYCVHGKPIHLGALNMPMFVVGTERDHVSPWRSVFKLHLLTHTEIGFVLASGGHNAGIVSEPGRARRFRFRIRHKGEHYIGPAEWFDVAPVEQGSWWPCWQQWLADRSDGQIAPPRIGAGAVLCDAPGTYVLES